MKRAVVIPDQHFPIHDEKAVKVVLKAIEEIKEVNKQIDRFDKALDKVKCNTRHILAGNHDEWLDAFVLENPYLE